MRLVAAAAAAAAGQWRGSMNHSVALSFFLFHFTAPSERHLVLRDDRQCGAPQVIDFLFHSRNIIIVWSVASLLVAEGGKGTVRRCKQSRDPRSCSWHKHTW
uniref:Putative secreted protein n=1 Tax=Anopheles marajoara TaxID=58244 RepID=A0A2M4C8J1_9DIPT